MGHAYFDEDGVRGHIHFSDYGFRFLWWVMLWGGYTGPQFYVNIPWFECTFSWSSFKLCDTWEQRWWELKCSFHTKEYERMILPGEHHIIWWAFNRWYKKNKEKLS